MTAIEIKNVEQYNLEQSAEIQNKPAVPEKEPDPLHDIDIRKDIRDDYRFTRDILRDMAETGAEGTKRLAEIANFSDEARYFEALSQIIKNTADVSEKLISMQRDIVDMMKDESAGPETKDGGAVVFDGTPASLRRMLQDEGDGGEEKK